MNRPSFSAAKAYQPGPGCTMACLHPGQDGRPGEAEHTVAELDDARSRLSVEVASIEVVKDAITF
jgi:hypothetical protein